MLTNLAHYLNPYTPEVGGNTQNKSKIQSHAIYIGGCTDYVCKALPRLQSVTQAVVGVDAYV